MSTRSISDLRQQKSFKLRSRPESPFARALVAPAPYRGFTTEQFGTTAGFTDEIANLVAIAASGDLKGLIARWRAFAHIAGSQGQHYGLDAWFKIVRALARHLDKDAVAIWIHRTRTIAMEYAPDKVRVERYVDLFLNAYPWELRELPDRSSLIAVEEIIPERVTLGEEPVSLLDALDALGGESRALHLRLEGDRPSPIGLISPELREFRDEQFALLGWSESMFDPAPAPEIFVLPWARFKTFAADHRGGIVFDFNKIVPRLGNEHFMLDMTGYVRSAPALQREALAFAPVCACPLNHYHELMDTFTSLLFHRLLPPETPVIVPKRYEVLRPLYEAAGIQWSSLREYGEVEMTVFDRVIAPASGSHQAGYPAFFSATATGLLQAGQRQNRRIYLSRSRTANRPLRNEAQVEAFVEARGFDVIHPQEHDLATQARMMAEAEIILAPHGAAFGNLPFARPNTLVIEILPDQYRVPCDYELASRCGLRYLPLLGSAFTDPDAGDFSWTVDIALIDRALALTEVSVFADPVEPAPTDEPASDFSADRVAA